MICPAELIPYIDPLAVMVGTFLGVVALGLLVALR